VIPLARLVPLVSTALFFSFQSLPTGDARPWGYLFHTRTRAIYPLRAPAVTIGRVAQADIVLSDQRISRRHAEIRHDEQGAALVDSGSTNGTRLNGRGVDAHRPARLAPGDVIELASDELVYHDDEQALWTDALRYVLLGQAVKLRVPVGQDRTTRTLGSLRNVTASSLAAVDADSGRVEMDYGEAGQGDEFFKIGEAALVGEAEIKDGALALSLWGWDRSGPMVSRRGAFTKLKHGELRVQPPGSTDEERAKRFRAGWEERGTEFLFPLIGATVELITEDDAGNIPKDFARELLEQQTPGAARDAAAIYAFRARRNRADPELAALVAKARARGVRLTATGRRASLTDKERSELGALLEEGREWLKKAQELGAKDKALSGVEDEFASAEKLLAGKL